MPLVAARDNHVNTKISLDVILFCAQLTAMDEIIIEALGGATKAGKALGVKPHTVSMWRERGISWRCRHKAVALARQAGVDVPDSYLDPNAGGGND